MCCEVPIRLCLYNSKFLALNPLCLCFIVFKVINFNSSVHVFRQFELFYFYFPVFSAIARLCEVFHERITGNSNLWNKILSSSSGISSTPNLKKPMLFHPVLARKIEKKSFFLMFEDLYCMFYLQSVICFKM